MFKLERRVYVSRKTSVLVIFLSLLLAFFVTGLIFHFLGVDVVQFYSIIYNVFITPALLIQAVFRSIPIILASLGLVIAFRMGFWNIGAEGQIYLGMVAATGIVILHVSYGTIPEPLMLITMGTASFLAGGVWCLIPASLKVRLGVNEVLTTLMLNYIAMLFVDYLVYGPWRDPEGWGFALSIPFPDYATLTFSGHPSIAGIVISVAIATLVYILFKYTKLGFVLSVLGKSSEVAKYAGMPVGRATLLGSLISGGIAGLGGFYVVSGMIGRLRPRASPGYGYAAIIVAMLAQLNPWLILPAGIFFGGLLTAGDALQSLLRLPYSAITVFQSVIFLCIVLAEFFIKYRVVLKR
ncbi:MAG: ABC transporter permease [Nitrososphaerota archaeon]|nr:ABC transporter permease [Aigarchaeota archaeon]MDW8076712.1 ABC transporter permease [Nitrososphaerota archaeon]